MAKKNLHALSTNSESLSRQTQPPPPYTAVAMNTGETNETPARGADEAPTRVADETQARGADETRARITNEAAARVADGGYVQEPTMDMARQEQPAVSESLLAPSALPTPLLTQS